MKHEFQKNEIFDDVAHLKSAIDSSIESALITYSMIQTQRIGVHMDSIQTKQLSSRKQQ